MDTKSFPFLTLPNELQMMILRLCVPTDLGFPDPTKFRPLDPNLNALAVMLVCKHVHGLVQRILKSENTLWLHVCPETRTDDIQAWISCPRTCKPYRRPEDGSKIFSEALRTPVNVTMSSLQKFQSISVKVCIPRLENFGRVYDALQTIARIIEQRQESQDPPLRHLHLDARILYGEKQISLRLRDFAQYLQRVLEPLQVRLRQIPVITLDVPLSVITQRYIKRKSADPLKRSKVQDGIDEINLVLSIAKAEMNGTGPKR
ncbi:MAG: hypothetical protein M1831_006506 [Alyxoria varia]|nr:MAG: hypothetical protein M1831_006506 [Alyxoria varia]